MAGKEAMEERKAVSITSFSAVPAGRNADLRQSRFVRIERFERA
jgi:hypothetical protein